MGDIVKVLQHVERYIDRCLEEGLDLDEITGSFRENPLPTALTANIEENDAQLRRIGQLLLTQYWIIRGNQRTLPKTDGLHL